MCEVAITAMREDELLEYINKRNSFKECIKAAEQLKRIDHKKYGDQFFKDLQMMFTNKPIQYENSL